MIPLPDRLMLSTDPHRFVLACLLSFLSFGVPALRAADPESEAASDVLAGHSFHGEAFNEGPRQAAIIMPGMAKLEFETSTNSKRAKAFFLQGIAQLHGFWYLEAERSFRQAAKEDDKMAIAYWGMAMANSNNEQRARGLIDKAMKLRSEGASKREKLYIEALERFVPKKKKDDEDSEEEQTDAEKKAAKDAAKEAKKKRGERYIADLEKLIHEFPDDMEARAFMIVHMWQADRYGVKLTSRYAVSALIAEILAKNPSHPVHHYRIHLWDSAQPENALKSAADCGPSSPGIAHMWHMPGHIYSKLKRYADAAWQQEASARVDHAHMNRARLMPDQIHNFAHNNEWLTRNLLNIGRVEDALEQSRNLIALPRHPDFNSLETRGSYKYGQRRLLQTLSQYGLWDELIRESGGHNMPPESNIAQTDQWTSWLSVAHFQSGDRRNGAKALRSLQFRRLDLQRDLLNLAKDKSRKKKRGKKNQADSNGEGDDEETEEEVTDEELTDEALGETTPKRRKRSDLSREEIRKQLTSLREVIARGAAAAAVARKDKAAFQKNVKAAKLDNTMQAQWTAQIGDLAGAVKLAESAVKKDASQVRPLAVLVDLLWQQGKKDAAKKRFETLRKVAADADLDTPMMTKLKPVAEFAEVKGDWRIKRKPAADLGKRPPLEELGPFSWQPYPSPAWTAGTTDGKEKSNRDFEGKPRLVIFYLGFGCLHCVEQLHAFEPLRQEFVDAGIEVVAISTEEAKELASGIENFDAKLTIPLLAGGDKKAFKAFRCWDDFEDQPLHGTFLIDGNNRVRWQDISHEPFTKAEFLLEEAQRLLDLPQ